jgi:hypothetical protein
LQYGARPLAGIRLRLSAMRLRLSAVPTSRSANVSNVTLNIRMTRCRRSYSGFKLPVPGGTLRVRVRLPHTSLFFKWDLAAGVPRQLVPVLLDLVLVLKYTLSKLIHQV